LHFICESDTLSTVIIRDLKKWENLDWRGITNRGAWKALVNVLRQRCATTTFRKAKDKIEWDLIDKGRSAARRLTSENAIQTIELKTIHHFNLSGVKLSSLTQRLAYRMIRITKHTQRPATQRNLTAIATGIDSPNGNTASEADIWTSLNTNEIRKSVSDFLWKCIHNAHRCGEFWKKIPEYEERAICTYCDTTETLEHIMTQCQAPGCNTIWNLAGTVWMSKQAEWTRPSYEEIMGVGLKKWYTAKMKRRPTAERFWRILISESAYLIWCLRCERTIGHSDEPGWTHSKKEIAARWTSMLNKRLQLDMSMTHRRFGRQALRKDIVIGTWRGTLQDEYALPDDWTGTKGVLVG
ncbi:uncharacterized protein C8Q71DRAFT_685566, partial [Rhodofomes roseus]